MPNIYSSAAAVKQYTGVKYSDLGFANDEEYSLWLEERLVEIKDLIDADRNRDYHEEVALGYRTQIPPGIHNIALRIAANMLAQAVLRRETPIVRIDDFTIKMVEDQIFTNAIKKDLSRYPAKPRFRLLRVNTVVEETETYPFV